MLTAGPEAVAAAKALIADVWGRPIDEAMPITAAAIAARRVSAEGQEGCGRFSTNEAVGRDQDTKDTRTRRHDETCSPPICLRASVLDGCGSMIRRLLIANRGEIALRIIRACRELGIETRRGLLRCRRARAARRAPPIAPSRIGPAPAARELPVDPTAARCGARDAAPTPSIRATDFSPRTPAFAAAARRPGIIFVGPPPTSSRRWDRRSRRGALMRRPACRSCRARRPTISPTRASPRRRARRLSGAGQGVGGRRRQGHAPRAATPARSTKSIQAARREAPAAFGDGTLYVERLIERPRHVEIQIFARRTRQRRASVRARVLDPAAASEGDRGEPVAGADAGSCARGWATRRSRPRARVGYRNAGTVEFLLDGSGDAPRSTSSR